MPAPTRTWSLQEANDALPRVRTMLQDLRRARAAVLELDAHLKDLLIVHGAAVRSGGPGHDEWRELIQRRMVVHGRLHEAVAVFRTQGIEVKDVDQGLVDFWAFKGKELVFLCWKEGEPSVSAWHGVHEGFAGRQPVPEQPSA